jgi:hypothetical protein
MKKLFLKYRDEYHEPKSVLVDRENFVIGRSPDSDLSVPRSELSRYHAEINRFSDVYVISDCNSSNGTTVNGQRLENPIPLENDYRINLGGVFELQVEFTEEDAGFQKPQPFPDDSPEAPEDFAEGSDDFNENPAVNAETSEPFSPAINAPAAPVSAAASSDGSFPKLFFILAPLLGLFVLVFAGGLLFLLGGSKQKEKPSFTDDYDYSERRESENKRKSREKDETPTPKTTETTSASETPSKAKVEPTSTPSKPAGELDKIERHAIPFMRRIAIKDDTYVFTQKQLGEINSQIKSFKGSSALRENLKIIKRDSAKFEELAKSKGLRPQFLAAAALARIGNKSENPLVVAQAMLPVLGELKITLGNELADENLLVIAAYDLGEQKRYRAMQTTLEALTKQSQGVPANQVRTIWFLRQKGKLTDAQYNFALRFLAIGTITQNPKDFGVEAEAITF